MADQEETTAEKPAGGSKKFLIIGIAFGLLFGGGGVGAFMMMAGDKAPEKHPEIVIDTKPKTDPHFVKVERVTIPLVQNNRVLGNMLMELSLEVDGNDNKMKVVRNLPEIRDALLRHYSRVPIGKKDNPRSVDYPRLKKTTQDISNKILNEPLVRRVMVVQAQQF